MAKRNSRKKATRKQHQLRIKEREEREDDDDNDDEVVEDDADSESEQHEGDDMENGGDDVEDSDSHNDSDDSEEEEDDDMDIAAVFHGKSGAADDDDEEEDDDDDDSDSEEKRLVAAAGATAASMSSDQYIFDLRKLLAVDNDQIPHSVLYRKPGDTPNKASSDGKSITIPLDESLGLTINEDFLLSRVTEGCTQLINALWQLPTEQSDAGPLVTLPGYDEIILPRALPPPPPKQETKWEKFAKAKGIPLNKEKRSRKVWDEAAQSWMYRHGYEKANKKDQQWPIMEVGANDDPFDDPWEKQREAKRARVEQNIERRMKNEERAGNLAKGATNRAMKSREKAYQVGKQAGTKDRETLPTGVPVDLKGASSQLRGKASTLAALSAVQTSTASLGKFDKMREGEPERRKTLNKSVNKKRKPGTSTDQKVLSTENANSIKILKAVMNGGAAKEKAIKKGQMAKGETAYDYDYDDGLGASSFRKKKGRAGAGKMKKMTKKRAK